MDQRKSERASAVQFWTECKDECTSIRSVKAVFTKYKQYAEERELPVLNEYIFRTYIRKHGYK